MKKLIIGIDADGVLTDMYNFNKINGMKIFKRPIKNENGYDINEMFECNKKEFIKYGLKSFIKYCTKCEYREDAAIVINKFKNSNFDVHNITARMFATDRNILGSLSRHMLEDCNRKNGIVFDSIQYCSEKFSERDKLLACHKLNVDIMIEDKPEVALKLANNGIRVLLFDCPYNQDIFHDNITRVYTWKQIDMEVNKIANVYGHGSENYYNFENDTFNSLSNADKIEYLWQYKEYLKQQNFDKKENNKYNINFKLAYSLFRLPVKAKFNIKVDGYENIPFQDGLLLASNHLNKYDQFIISYAFGKRPIRGLASSTIENTFRGKIFKKVGITFVDRNDKESRKKASVDMKINLANNNNYLIFPEGTRKDKTEEGRKKQILNFHFGAVSSAQKTGAPLLPIALQYTKKYTLIKFGSPIIISATESLEDANDNLQKTIVNMLEENKVKIKRNDLKR